MHLFNFFPRIQFLRDLGIISARQLPVESFLHDACFFGYLGDFWLTLHAVVPLPFFLSLSLSSSPLQPPFIIDGVILRSKHQGRKEGQVYLKVGSTSGTNFMGFYPLTSLYLTYILINVNRVCARREFPADWWKQRDNARLNFLA